MDSKLQRVIDKNRRALAKAAAKAAADVPAEVLRNIIISRFERGEGIIGRILKRR